MSFTPDELQSFNTILEQRLAAHRREVERSLDQRMNTLRRDFEQRLLSMQQELLRRLPQRIIELQSTPGERSEQKFDRRQARAMQEIKLAQQEQLKQVEGVVERALAAQLLAIEQLIHQRSPAPAASPPAEGYLTTEVQADFDGIEVQTELPWDDLVDEINKAVDRRLDALNESLQASMRDLANYLSMELHGLRENLTHMQGQPYTGNPSDLREVFTSIEQLERIIESMQVAMNANHALLSNRLYHHQQLPPDRAHLGTPSSSSQPAHANGNNNSLPLPKGQEDEQPQG